MKNIKLPSIAARHFAGPQQDTFPGTAGRDTLSGTTGNDTLDGGANADTMTGLDGDDLYFLDNSGDRVFENAGNGYDTVRTAVTYTLAANIEALILSGTKAGNLTGNDLDNALTGNAGNNTISGGIGADDMTGGIGNDVFVVDNSSDIVREQAGEGTDSVLSSVSFSLAGIEAQGVEKLTLTGAAVIDGIGNALANTLTGNAAANRLDGGAGADKMIGGAGDDTFVVDNAGDSVSDTSGGDTVEAAVSYTLGTGIEILRLGGTSNINGTGNTSVNTLYGNDGDNLLNGGSGADTLAGGAGNDTYVVDNMLDIVIETVGEGTDFVQSAVSHILSVNVENLLLTGTGAINGTGNAGDNTLTGGKGANILDGGAGADLMLGGLGKDTYVVDNAGDVVVETSTLTTEIDSVQSAVSFTLGANFENLTLTAAGAGTGNALANLLNGSAGTDTLQGAAGKDKLYGNGGGDTIDGGSGDDAIYGGDGDDTVVLNLRASTLSGGHRNEMDTLDGGAGNDTLVIRLTNAQYIDPAISSALTALQNAINGGNAATFTSTVLGLKAVSFSALQIEQAPLVNTAPSDILLGHSSVSENAAGATIGVVTVTDANIEDTHVLTVDDARFEITGGQLKLKSGQSLDFESEPSVTLHLTATDPGGLSVARDITIQVTNTNEAPSNITLASAVVAENAAGAVIGGVTVTDPDAGDTFTYAFSDTRFEIVSGQLKLKDGIFLDYEATTSVPLHITATDAGGLSIFKDFTITVTNVTGDLPYFTDGDNSIDMNSLANGVYDPSLLHDALGGNDNVTLPTGAKVAGLGYDNTIVFHGNTGNDTIIGDILRDTLAGDAGNDTLFSGADDDTLNGGTGDDTLNGATGNDTYIFHAGDGIDRILDASAAGTGDKILLSGIDPANVYLWSDGTQMTLQYGSGDSVTVAVGGASLLPYVESIEFDDAAHTVWDLSQGLFLRNNDTAHSLVGSTLADVIIGGAGNEIILANGGDDTITGGRGNDTLNGTSGNDTYIFHVGDGVDRITDASAAGTGDKILLSGIDPANVYLWSDGTQMTLQYGSGDSVTADVGGTNLLPYVESIEFDDMAHTVWDLSQGLFLRNNDTAHSLVGSTLADVIIGGAGNEIILANGGDDTITGGRGNDTLNGTSGNDTYIFHVGDGADRIMESAAGTGDKILLSGIDPANVYLWSDGGQMTLQYGVGDSVTVDVGGESLLPYVESIEFADMAHTVWDLSQGLFLRNNDTAHSLVGSTLADVIIGGAAAETLIGLDGNDILTGGGGVNRLTGGTGADTFCFMSPTASDTVSDFNSGQGDKLDVSSLLTGYDPLADSLGDFVQLVQQGGNTLLKVDLDGTGSGAALTIATLSGVTGLADVDTLVANGTLIV